MITLLRSLIENRPSFGYFGSVFPPAIALLTWVSEWEAAVSLLAILVGIAVGVLTGIVQFQNARMNHFRHRDEEAEREKRRKEESADK